MCGICRVPAGEVAVVRIFGARPGISAVFTCPTCEGRVCMWVPAVLGLQVLLAGAAAVDVERPDELDDPLRQAGTELRDLAAHPRCFAALDAL